MLVIIGIILLAIAFLAFVSQQKTSDSSLAQIYQLQSTLFSAAERSFLGALQQACADEYLILGKVRVADVIKVKYTKNSSLQQKSFNRIRSKHFDFVLCDKNDLSIRCAIELDDKSHQNSSRQQRDQFLNDLSKAVKLPLVRFPAKRGYVVAQIRENLMTAMSLPPSKSVTEKMSLVG